MSLNVSNCKRCKRIFQRRLSDSCPECLKEVEAMCSQVYHALQQSAPQGGIAINDLADQLGISTDDIDMLYMESRLGTAGSFLKKECQACGLLTREFERKGRYCLICSHLTASQAGVEVKSLNELREEEEERRRREEQKARLAKVPIPTRNTQTQEERLVPRRFGFTTSSSRIPERQ